MRGDTLVQESRENIENKFSLKGKIVRLRPFQETDIEHIVRAMTVDTEWQQWDAPWELEEAELFDPERYRELSKRKIENLRQKEAAGESFIYRTLIIERLSDGEFLGRINSYQIDDHYDWTEKGGYFTIGIDIFKKKHRRCGYGREAWALYLDYLRTKGITEVYTQTWSGNIPVQILIEKFGFNLVHVKKNYQLVQGKNVDGYSYCLHLIQSNRSFTEHHLCSRL